jgi:lipopolysaccharide exporter
MAALRATSRLLGTIRLLVLARVLGPHEFGVVGIAAVVISVFEAFATKGTQLALIHRRERARELFDTAWTLGLIRGGAAAGLMVVFAPAMGRFFDSPEAVAVVRVMALMPLIRSFTNLGVVEFTQELTLGPQYVLQTSGVVADLCVAVPMALWLGNVWALVAGWLALTAVQVVMSYVLHPYRPKVRWDRRQAGELFGYSRWIFGSTAIGWFVTDGVHAAVGKLVGAQALGLYQMAWRLASPTLQVSQVVSRVTVPAYAKLRDSPLRTRRAYLRILAAVALGAVPISVGIGLYGEDLVRVLLGERWRAIVPIVPILAGLGLVRSIGATAAPLFQAMGQPRSETFVAMVELGVAGALIGPLTLRMGPVGAAVAATTACVVGAAVALWRVSRVLELRAVELLTPLGWPFLACVPCGALRVWLGGPVTGVVALAGTLLVFGTLYLSGLLLLDWLKLYALDPVVPSPVREWLPRHL